jgi:hypothetical protein
MEVLTLPQGMAEDSPIVFVSHQTIQFQETVAPLLGVVQIAGSWQEASHRELAISDPLVFQMFAVPPVL